MESFENYLNHQLESTRHVESRNFIENQLARRLELLNSQSYGEYMLKDFESDETSSGSDDGDLFQSIVNGERLSSESTSSSSEFCDVDYYETPSIVSEFSLNSRSLLISSNANSFSPRPIDLTTTSCSLSSPERKFNENLRPQPESPVKQEPPVMTTPVQYCSTSENPRKRRVFQNLFTNHNSPAINQSPVTKTPTKDIIKPNDYLEKRRKNNISAKRSRDKKKMRENEIARRNEILEQENILLKFELVNAKNELQVIRNFVKTTFNVWR